MFKLHKHIVVACLAFCASVGLHGQNTLDTLITAPRGTPNIPVRLGYFNVNTGNLHLEIPVTSTPQRGMGPNSSTLVYDSSFWFSNSMFPGDNPVIYPERLGSLSQPYWHGGGFSGLPSNGPVASENVRTDICGSGFYGSIETYFEWIFVDTLGNTHLFEPGTTNTQNCADATGKPEYPNGYGYSTASGFATDGSGYFISITNGNTPIVFSPDGSDYDTTANGNQLYYGANSNRGTSSCDKAWGNFAQPYVATAPAHCQGTYHAVNGSASSSTFSSVYEYVPVCTAYDANEASPVNTYDYCGGIWALQSLTLPDGVSTYSFQYDTGTTPGHYGQMTSMLLPTGGNVTYTYYSPTGNGASDPGDGRGDLKSITDNGGTNYFNRTFTSSPSPTPYSLSQPQFATATVTYPAHILDPLQPTTLATDQSVFTATQPTATTVTVTQQDYLNNVLTKTTGWDATVAGIPAFTQTTWNQTNTSDKVQYTYATGDVVARADEYVNGSLYRSKTASFQQDTASVKYVSQFYMVNYPILTQILNASGTVIAQESRTYDEYGASYCNATPPGVGATPMLKSVTGALAHDDTDFGTNRVARGNATTITTGTSTGGTTTIHNCYDTLGNVTETVDGNGNPTAFSYADNYSDTSCINNTSGSNPPTYTFLTLKTDALGHQNKKAYNSCLGAVTQSQDANDLAASRAGTQQTFDLDGRPLCTTFPDGGSSCSGYPSANSITQTTQLTSSQAHSTTTTLSSFNNVASIVDNSSNSETDKTYDAAGRLSTVSNPYTVGSGTHPVTSYAYDGLGRTLAQLQADGSSELTWTYTGTNVDAYDEVKVHRQLQNDVLGRLLTVMELGTSSSPLNYETDYSYDVLNNLIQVDQWGGPKNTSGERQRTFTYDSLSELLCASNPENSSSACPSVEPGSGPSGLPAGTLRYTYDGNGNLHSRTDARGVSTTYAYDGLNRVTAKAFSDGVSPSASFSYDSSSVAGNANTIGRLTSESTLVGSSTWTKRQPYAYDAVGRVKSELQCTLQNCSGTANSLQYTYDLAGDMTSSTNGVSNPGVQITNAYDGAARLMSVSSTWSDAQHPPTLFSATASSSAGCGLSSLPAYDAANQLQYAQIGVNTQSQAAFSTTRCYDNRLRPASESDASQQSSPATAASTMVTISGTEKSLSGSGTAAKATASISLSYSGGAQVKGVQPLYVGNSITLPDGYHVGFIATANSAVTVANALAGALNQAGSPVTAVVTGGGTASAATVVLTSKVTGADQNGTIRLSLLTTKVKAGAASMSGGAGTNYDVGSVTANVDGTSVSASYNQSSTAQTVASALATAINGAGAGVTATATGSGNITVSSTQTGTASNGLTVTLSSASSETKYFSSASFSGTSGTLGGGSSGSSAGLVYNYSIPAAGASTGGYDGAGNLLSYSDCVASNCITGTWALNYDSLNRAQSGAVSAGPWNGLNLSWVYDAFGNRTSQTVGGTPPPNAGLPQSQTLSYSSKNQIGNFGAGNYDAAGNVNNDLINQYAYDGEGRICAVAYPYVSTTGYEQYIYDAEGRRVAKGTVSSLSCNVASNGYAQTESYLLGQSGERLSELDGTGSFERGHVYANGQLLDTYTSSTTQFAFSDWLGSKRVLGNPDGTVTGTCTNLPFGDALSCSNGVSLNEHHFTGQVHDQTTGNDHFGARYYANYTGRFLSPDPSELYFADPTNPQSLNLYSYGRNNPLVNIDPTGLDCVYINNDTGTYTSFSSGDCNNATEASANSGYYIDGTVNQIAFNRQGQVVGYSASSGDGTFDSFAGSQNAGVGTALLNPYSGVVSSPGQTVSVNGNSPTDLNVNSTSLSSQIPVGYKPLPPGVDVIGPNPPRPSPNLAGDPACFGAPEAVSEIHSLAPGQVRNAAHGSTDGSFGTAIYQNTTRGNRPFGNSGANAGFSFGFMLFDYAVSVANCRLGR